MCSTVRKETIWLVSQDRTKNNPFPTHSTYPIAIEVIIDVVIRPPDNDLSVVVRAPVSAAVSLALVEPMLVSDVEEDWIGPVTVQGAVMVEVLEY